LRRSVRRRRTAPIGGQSVRWWIPFCEAAPRAWPPSAGTSSLAFLAERRRSEWPAVPTTLIDQRGGGVVLLCPGYLSQRLRGSMSRRRRDSRSSLRAPIAVPATRTMSSAATAATTNQVAPAASPATPAANRAARRSSTRSPPSALGETDPYARRASVRPVPPTAVRTCPEAPTNRQPWPSGANAAASARASR
jgi:hypothetical protein